MNKTTQETAVKQNKVHKESFLRRFWAMFRYESATTLQKMKKAKGLYLFMLPFLIIFVLFYIAPVVISIFYSFTYYNVLETPKFIGLQNYINLFLADDVFLTAIKNTLLIAVITGPVGYLASFAFAWLINELPRSIRAIAVTIFYAPSISGQAYLVWGILFSGDSYGFINALLLDLGIIDSSINWLTNPDYIMPVMLIVILWMSLGTGFLSFIAGLQGLDRSQIEAGYVDGISNRWQELWFIVLPNMKPMLLFGAVMAITQSFGVADVTMSLAGFPSTDYAARTVVTHLFDYGSVRFDMGYACSVATVLFVIMILCNNAIQALLRRVGK